LDFFGKCSWIGKLSIDWSQRGFLPSFLKYHVDIRSDKPNKVLSHNCKLHYNAASLSLLVTIPIGLHLKLFLSDRQAGFVLTPILYLSQINHNYFGFWTLPNITRTLFTNFFNFFYCCNIYKISLKKTPFKGFCF
jgi:hypothetical protein